MFRTAHMTALSWATFSTDWGHHQLFYGLSQIFGQISKSLEKYNNQKSFKHVFSAPLKNQSAVPDRTLFQYYFLYDWHSEKHGHTIVTNHSMPLWKLSIGFFGHHCHSPEIVSMYNWTPETKALHSPIHISLSQNKAVQDHNKGEDNRQWLYTPPLEQDPTDGVKTPSPTKSHLRLSPEILRNTVSLQRWGVTRECSGGWGTILPLPNAVPPPPYTRCLLKSKQTQGLN